MITKAQLLERAKAQELLPTTVEKDYVLGWTLNAISHHRQLSQWVFKGGTCLKKCFFETYRFSEDLDFTIPPDLHLSQLVIEKSLAEAGAWIEEQSGIAFPAEKITVEQYTNPRGKESYQARLTYSGPLNLPRNSMQRIKFDITQDELLVDTPDEREVSHPYEDAQDPAPRVRCYSIDEILAEKTRALYERQGRARDVYDLVHLSRDFRSSIDPGKASAILRDKFEFKGLPEPTVDLIMGRVEEATLRANWVHQLDHQLPMLPPVDGFLPDLSDAIAWWHEPDRAAQLLPAAPGTVGEELLEQEHLPTKPRPSQSGGLWQSTPTGGMGPFDKIRFAARNRLCAEISYTGVSRVIEPYSLRRSSRGKTLLYAHELLRNGHSTGQTKGFDVRKIRGARITDQPFKPRYRVEL